VKDKKPEPKKPEVKSETISRQRVSEIQSRGIGKMRRRLYAMGITCMADIK
jgi:Fe2+ transport system protein FeoA